MTTLTPVETTWLAVLAELRDSPAITVHNEHGTIDEDLADACTAASEIAEDYDIPLGPWLEDCHTRFAALGSSWETVAPHPFVAGEFYLESIQRAFEDSPPELGWTDLSAEDRELQYELRTIDGTPDWGVGALAALRAQPGVASPEIWFDHHRFGHWKMDLDYPGYLAALRVTKGTFGWQYLFTDVSLRGAEFEGIRTRLVDMLTIFPELFPGHDYAPLRARLAERTR